MRLTEKKRIKIDNECKDYPIYLTWLNSLGGYSYWLFFKNHTETTNTKFNSSYDINISDLETAVATNDAIGKDAVPSIEVGARVKAEDMDGITGLFESPKVMMLANPETWAVDGPVWKRVILKAGSMVTLKTGTAYLNVKFNLQLPYKFTQKE